MGVGGTAKGIAPPTLPVRVSIAVIGKATATKAIPVDSSNARLDVSFSGSNTADPSGNYWIRDIAPDYSWAIVSDNLGRNDAILTRQRTVEPVFYQALVRRASFLGVSTGAITRTPQLGELG